MTIRRQALPTETNVLADRRQVRVVCSTPEVGRDGIVLISEGVDLSSYKTNPVVLWQHDADRPVARAIQIGVSGGSLEALVQFPDEGISPKADEVYGLIRSGVINAVSVGIDPLQVDDGSEGGQRIVKAEMLEFSFVSIPAVRGALITERAAQMPAERSTASATAGENSRGMRARITRGLVVRGLWDVGALAHLLDQLGWVKCSAEMEAAAEDDGSKVPAMLGDVLKRLGDALLAMTAEEVAELLTDGDVDAAAATIEAAAMPQVARFRAGAAAIARSAPFGDDPRRRFDRRMRAIAGT